MRRSGPPSVSSTAATGGWPRESQDATCARHRRQRLRRQARGRPLARPSRGGARARPPAPSERAGGPRPRARTRRRHPPRVAAWGRGGVRRRIPLRLGWRVARGRPPRERRGHPQRRRGGGPRRRAAHRAPQHHGRSRRRAAARAHRGRADDQPGRRLRGEQGGGRAGRARARPRPRCRGGRAPADPGLRPGRAPLGGRLPRARQARAGRPGRRRRRPRQPHLRGRPGRRHVGGRRGARGRRHGLSGVGRASSDVGRLSRLLRAHVPQAAAAGGAAVAGEARDAGPARVRRADAAAAPPAGHGRAPDGAADHCRDRPRAAGARAVAAHLHRRRHGHLRGVAAARGAPAAGRGCRRNSGSPPGRRVMSRAVSKNFAFIAVSNLLAPMFSLVLVLAISHLQGVETLGKYSLLMSVFVFVMSAAGFGLPVVLTREAAQGPQDAGRWFVNAVALSSALALPILAVALVLCALRVSDRDMALALGLTALTVLPSAVAQCAEAVLLAFEHARDFVVINLAETAVRAVIGTGLVVAGFGVVAIAVLLLALRVASALVFVLALRRRGVHGGRLDRRTALRLAGYVPVTGLIPVVNALYARSDVFLLSTLGSWRDVGLYSAALRLVDLARTVTPAFARAMYPVLARLRAAGQSEYAVAARRATRNGLLLSVPIVLGLYGCAGPVIRLLFGADLAGAADILRILAWSVLPFAIAIVLAP